MPYHLVELDYSLQMLEWEVSDNTSDVTWGVSVCFTQEELKLEEEEVLKMIIREKMDIRWAAFVENFMYCTYMMRYVVDLKMLSVFLGKIRVYFDHQIGTVVKNGIVMIENFLACTPLWVTISLRNVWSTCTECETKNSQSIKSSRLWKYSGRL